MIDRVEILENVLRKDKRLIDKNNNLMKSKIIELINKSDKNLLELLLENDEIKDMFFTEVNNTLVFDRDNFSYYIDNNSYLEDSYTKYRKEIFLMEDKYMTSINNCGDVVLSFPHKDCFLEMDSTKEDDQRNEVFLNEIIMKNDIDTLKEPKVFKNVKRTNVDGEERNVQFTYDQNYLIKGNNLLAMYSLLPRYKSKIKLMYWDVLYNTEDDQISYNDSFKHSSWLVMMKNRLEVAKELLDSRGCICVQINDIEKDYLKVLMDEIFGRDNYISTISVRTKSPSGFQSVNPGVFKTAEYIIVYTKNKPTWEYNVIYSETEYDKNYKWFITNINEDYSNWNIVNLFEHVAKLNGCKDAKEARHKFGKLVFNQMCGQFALDNSNSVFRLTAIGEKAGKEVKELKDISMQFPKTIYMLQREKHYDVYMINGEELAFYSKKIRNIDGRNVPSMQITNIWNDIAYEGIAKEGNATLKKGKKPEKLIKRILEMGSNEGDIVLDAYLGSGTTSAVAHKMGRKYIGIEQLSKHSEMAFQRMKSVVLGDKSGISKLVKWRGGGNFVSMELANNSSKYIDAIVSATDSDTLITILNELINSSFITYRVDINSIKKSMNKFNEFSIKDKKQFLIDIVEKNTLYINYSSIEEKDFDLTDSDKVFNYSFYTGVDK